MRRDAFELAHRLAREAEAVCRHYLSNGKREGRYWLVGDVYNTPGRSMFVRLQNSPKGPAGKWTDAATGEHGDLLDVIRQSLGLRDFREVAEEARRFLKLPRRESERVSQLPHARSVVPGRSQEAARRLFAISGPIEGTMVEAYLRGRGIARVHHGGSLRFHPRCYYRPDEHLPTETWPAMIACVTDLAGRITGVHRTWLDPDGFDRIRLGKAPIDTPRRAMGDLLGNAVRFGPAGRRRARGRRRHRNHALAALRAANIADGRSVVGQSPRSHGCCRRACVGSISRGTPMPQAIWCKPFCRTAHKRPASKQSPCHLGWAISTRICTSSVSTPYERPCGYSSHQRTSPAFFSCRRPSYRRRLAPIEVDSSVAAAQCRRGATTAF